MSRPLVWAGLLAAVALTALEAASPSRSAAGAFASPTLTVVGFGKVSLPPAPLAPPQLVLTLGAAAPTATGALAQLRQDVANVRQRLAHVGVSPSAVSPTPAQLSYNGPANVTTCHRMARLKPGLTCPTPGFQASETLQVSFPTLDALGNALTHTGVDHAKGVASAWIAQPTQPTPIPSPAALEKGYRQALADAAQTAAALAQAEHRLLGPPLTITEGAVSPSFCAGGCPPQPPFGVPVPAVGPNEELVAVTVTYPTSAP